MSVMSLPVHAQRDLENMVEQKKQIDLKIDFLKSFKNTIRDDERVDKINREIFWLLAEQNKLREWLQEYGIKSNTD